MIIIVGVPIFRLLRYICEAYGSRHQGGALLLFCCHGNLSVYLSITNKVSIPIRLIEPMMGLRPKQGNLRLVFRLFSLMRGLPSTRIT